MAVVVQESFGGKRRRLGTACSLACLAFAEATNEIDDASKIVFRRLHRSRLHQFEFERELIGFAAAFWGGVVFTVEHIQRTRQDIGVIGLPHDALGEKTLLRNIRRSGFPQDHTVWLISGILWQWRWVVFANTFQAGFQFVSPLAIAEGGHVFGTDSGDGSRRGRPRNGGAAKKPQVARQNVGTT